MRRSQRGYCVCADGCGGADETTPRGGARSIGQLSSGYYVLEKP